MRFAYTNSHCISQRARRDKEREINPDRGPPRIPHGSEIGSITIRLHGQVVEAQLLQHRTRSRTHTLVIDGVEIGQMGLYAAAAEVSARVARVPGRRSDFWD